MTPQAETPPPPDQPTRLERMVGEIIGLRMLVSELLADIGAKSGDADRYLMETRAAAMRALDQWVVRSDTSDSADRIKRCAHGMLRQFPGPMRFEPKNDEAEAKKSSWESEARPPHNTVPKSSLERHD